MNDGIDLLQLVLNFETKDPLILSCVLTNVSALFPFVTYRPEYLPQVLSKVGACRPCENQVGFLWSRALVRSCSSSFSQHSHQGKTVLRVNDGKTLGVLFKEKQCQIAQILQFSALNLNIECILWPMSTMFHFKASLCL